MAGSKSAYLENKALDTVLGGPTYTLPGTVYIALSTQAFNKTTPGTEVSAAGYARAAVTNNATNWPPAASSQKSNATVITFPAAQADWGTITAFYIYDAASTGNVLYGADLSTARFIANGDTASFAVSAITLIET
jgi:hypothetical protein